MHLQHAAVDRCQQFRQFSAVEPGRQRGDAQRQGRRQSGTQLCEEYLIGWQPSVAGIVINFHAGQSQALGLPIGEHLLDLCNDIILIQRLELAIQTNHRNQWPIILLEQPRINPRPSPAFLRECLQRQHPQGREIRTAIAQCGLMGRGPLALPDVELLIEWWGISLLTATEQPHCSQQGR